MDADYEAPKHNASDDDIQHIFQSAKAIAVVGLSRHHEADSYRVAAYLQEHGFRIIPVHPKVKKILDEECYDCLEDVPEKEETRASVINESRKKFEEIESKISRIEKMLTDLERRKK